MANKAWKDRIHTLTVAKTRWRKKVPCASVSLSQVYGSIVAQQQIVQEYCSKCPQKQACLEYALTNSEIYGVWGGTDEAERSKMISTMVKTKGSPRFNWNDEYQQHVKELSQ